MKMHIAALAALTLAAGLVFSGCASAPSQTTRPGNADSSDTDSIMLADHGLSGLDARQIIERLDTMPLTDRPANLIASIRPDRLVLSDDQERELSLPMPADQFYVSFAPYLTQTHDCHFHSLTTCVGELQNADIQVKVTDVATGEVLVDEERRTFDNGFLGLWLPRDIEATLTVEYQGRAATLQLTTKGDEAATCVTTLRLG